MPTRYRVGISSWGLIWKNRKGGQVSWPTNSIVGISSMPTHILVAYEPIRGYFLVAYEIPRGESLVATEPIRRHFLDTYATIGRLREPTWGFPRGVRVLSLGFPRDLPLWPICIRSITQTKLFVRDTLYTPGTLLTVFRFYPGQVKKGSVVSTVYHWKLIGIQTNILVRGYRSV